MRRLCVSGCSETADVTLSSEKFRRAFFTFFFDISWNKQLIMKKLADYFIIKESLVAAGLYMCLKLHKLLYCWFVCVCVCVCACSCHGPVRSEYPEDTVRQD